MAIAFDAVSPDTSSASNVSSLTSGSWTIAGSNRYLFGAAASGAGTPVTATDMKWGGSGGAALTALHTALSVGAFGRIRGFALVAPTAAAQTLYGLWGSAQDETAIGGASYTGVDQSTPIRNSGTPTTNSGTMTGSSPLTVSITVPNTVAGDVIVGAFWALDIAGTNPAFSGTGSSTLRYDVLPSAYEAMAIMEITATGTSTVLQASLACSGGFADWGGVAVAMIPGAAAAAQLLPRSILVNAAIKRAGNY